MTSLSTPSPDPAAAEEPNRSTSRRAFLQNTGKIVAATTGALYSPLQAWATNDTSGTAPAGQPRALNLHNPHTGDRLQTTYWADGEYLENQVLRISHLLRDHRENETMMIDVPLLDILWAVCQQIDPDLQFRVISGYRTPKTNEMLRKRSKGVAKYSLHMLGKAVDISASGSELQSIRDAGLKLAAGGVGYYPGSNFIHLDSGQVRSW